MTAPDLEAPGSRGQSEPLDPSDRQRVQTPLEQLEPPRFIGGGMWEGVVRRRFRHAVILFGAQSFDKT